MDFLIDLITLYQYSFVYHSKEYQNQLIILIKQYQKDHKLL